MTRLRAGLIGAGLLLLLGAVTGPVLDGVQRLVESARPAGEFPMLLQLNGQPVRWTMVDGGQSGLYAASGMVCAPLSGSGAQTVLIISETPTNLCIVPSTAYNSWDGGCNTLTGDPSFGVPTQAWVPQYSVLDPTATHICGVSDAGLVRSAIWKMY